MLFRRIIPGFVVCGILMAFLHLYPSPDTDHPELYQSYTAMRNLANVGNLEKSAFPYVFPSGRASDYVSYLFSPLGSGEWPMVEGVEFTKQEARIARIQQLPADVTIVPLYPREQFDKQLVIGYDDLENIVTADAYTAFDEKPVFHKEWPIPKVDCSELAASTAQSALDMGIDYEVDLENWGDEWSYEAWEDTSP